MLQQPERFAFVEGMRGVAAMQVVILHYCAAFLPVLARNGTYEHFTWETALSRSPIYLLMDGASGVYLFFVMSGFVLAPSFGRANTSGLSLAAKRAARLFLPVLAGGCVAVALYFLFPNALPDAVAQSRSDWLAMFGSKSLTAYSIAKDMFLNSMLTGYTSSSIFTGSAILPDILQPPAIGYSLNPPTWTLHVEFWGSLLLIAVAMLRRKLNGGLFWLAFVAIAIAVGATHFALFLLGFAIYQIRGRLLALTGFAWAALGIAIVLIGLYICLRKDIPVLISAMNLIRSLPITAEANDLLAQSQIGAALVFIGAMLCPPIRAFLSRPVFQWLGKLSFSVYLLHFPIMLTIGCAIFAALAPISYLGASLVAAGIGTAATLLGAQWFERAIDRRAVSFSRKLAISGPYGTEPQKVPAG